MSHWNYRIIKHESPEGDWFGVHEVHYNDDGDINAISEEAIAPIGDSSVELRKDLSMMQHAFLDDILVYDEIEFACVTVEESEEIDAGD